MQERNSSHSEQAHQPKTMAEHRGEFTERYPHLWRKKLDTSWIDENGEERIGRVYCFLTDTNYELDEADGLAKFILKARQSGFTIVDKTDFFDETSTIHQFTLEGRALHANSSQKSNVTDSLPTS